MNMIIRLCLVVMNGCAALYIISFMKSLCKKSYHIICPVLNKTFRKLQDYRDLKELYIQFNSRNSGNPIGARKELAELIQHYMKSGHEMFREFASLLEKYEDPIINSFIMVEKIGNGKIYDSRLSNGPI